MATTKPRTATKYTPAQIETMIRAEVARQGGDPSGKTAAVLIATAKHESNENPLAVGDNGTSFGLFQFHQGGALGSHTQAWAFNPINEIRDRVSKFLAANVTTGAGAAAIQRPANPTSYAASVDRLAGSVSTGAKQVAANVITKAAAALGTPYAYGGTSILGFDCSGLVQWAYKQLGVNVPRTSEQQYAASTKISASDAKPGDLVFFNNASHVGIYLGGGKMLDAPHTGSKVQVESLWANPTFGRIANAPTPDASIQWASYDVLGAVKNTLSVVPGLGTIVGGADAAVDVFSGIGHGTAKAVGKVGSAVGDKIGSAVKSAGAVLMQWGITLALFLFGLVLIVFGVLKATGTIGNAGASTTPTPAPAA